MLTLRYTNEQRTGQKLLDVVDVHYYPAMPSLGLGTGGATDPAIRAACGPAFHIVTPGIRPVDAARNDDQRRVVSPTQAFRSGADYIVVGRPIRDAADPYQVAAGIQAEIAAVFG